MKAILNFFGRILIFFFGDSNAPVNHCEEKKESTNCKDCDCEEEKKSEVCSRTEVCEQKNETVDEQRVEEEEEIEIKPVLKYTVYNKYGDFDFSTNEVKELSKKTGIPLSTMYRVLKKQENNSVAYDEWVILINDEIA